MYSQMLIEKLLPYSGILLEKRQIKDNFVQHLNSVYDT